MKVYTIFDTGLDGRFDELLNRISTKLYKEVKNGVIKIFIDTKDDIRYVSADLIRIAQKVDQINFIYKQMGKSSKVLEVLKNKGAETFYLPL
jgi:putative lipoic acid-binding regulatory protein